MSNFIQWTDQAFREMERLPQKLAFEIIRKTDLLSTFPEIGSDLGLYNAVLIGLRQLIVNRRWRVVYELDQNDSTVWILAVQSCRQKLPTRGSLRKRKVKTS
jgi:hypothetical protein